MSISKKIFIWLSSIFMVIFVFVAYFYYHMQINQEMDRLYKLGGMVGSVLEHSLDNFMITRDYPSIDITLHELAALRPIAGIWLINKNGDIKLSSNREEIGAQPPFAGNGDRTGMEQKQQGFSLKRLKTFRWIQPIVNKPKCYGCHGTKDKQNGAFIIDFSLSETEKLLEKNILIGFLVFIISFVALGFVRGFLAKKLITDRLDNIIDKITKFRKGDFSERITIKGQDELIKLEEGFNEMAEAVNTRDKEKDELFMKVSRSRKEWQDTFDNITDMIYILDRDLNIIRANRAFAEYYGLTPKDIINKNCNELYFGTAVPHSECPFAIVSDKNQQLTKEVYIPKANKILRISSFPYYSVERETQFFICIAEDITEEKEREMRLVMSERLASLGQMAAGIAHEINNPLASIAGCAEGLHNRVKKGQFESDLFESYLKIIEEEISRCKSITTSMLSFVRDAAYEKMDVNINYILDKTLEIISFQGRLRAIEVIKNYDQNLPVIHGSGGELKQVFMVIITNALDAMEDKGILTIETGIIPPSPPLEKGGWGGFVFIKISDTGIGIPPDNISRIFTPFFTTKPEKEGIGLGLSIANKIIVNHNGRIHIASEVGKGSIFKITLPI